MQAKIATSFILWASLILLFSGAVSAETLTVCHEIHGSGYAVPIEVDESLLDLHMGHGDILANEDGTCTDEALLKAAQECMCEGLSIDTVEWSSQFQTATCNRTVGPVYEGIELRTSDQQKILVVEFIHAYGYHCMIGDLSTGEWDGMPEFPASLTTQQFRACVKSLNEIAKEDSIKCEAALYEP